MNIVFEGIDRAGKSTLVNMLHEKIEGSGILKFPTKRGFTYRDDFLDDFKNNMPGKDSSRLLLIDRFWMSTAVYQAMTYEEQALLHKVTPIDHTFIMEVDFDVWKKRLDDESLKVFKKCGFSDEPEDIHRSITYRYRRYSGWKNVTFIHDSTNTEWQVDNIIRSLNLEH